MFQGVVERTSHEGGLMLRFSGPSPALGSILVNEEGQYVGKVDGVLGTAEDPWVHLAHLDRNLNPDDLISQTLTIRKKQDRKPRERPQRDNHRGRDDRRGRDERRGRDDRRGRGGQQNHGDNDWTCSECNNSNFSFRTECNRCGKAKSGGEGNRRRDDRRGRDNRRGRDDRRGRGGQQNHGDNDWTCSECNNSNFSFRTECNRCGKAKSGGGGNRRRDDRRGREDRGRDSRRRDDFRRPQRDERHKGKNAKDGSNDWTCSKCNNSNFAFRRECNKCGEKKGGGDRRPRESGPKRARDKRRGHHLNRGSPGDLQPKRYGRRRD